MLKKLPINERNVYLVNKDLGAAVDEYLGFIEKAGYQDKVEIVDVVESQDCITAEPVFAEMSSPFYNASAMDGICVKALEIIGVDERNPRLLELHVDFEYVDTGDVIEEPYNAVVMIEDVLVVDDTHVSIAGPVSLWQHVRPVGEDIVAGELILPAYHKVRAIDIGALLSGGIQELSVLVPPTVGIIPTGTELVEAGEEIAVGKIIDSNSRMFQALIKEYGAIPRRYSPVMDDYTLLKTAIQKAVAENDILCISAGSSAGTEDYTRALVEELGQVVTHGIATKPGKPAILGFIEGKPVIGIPGYPVSAYFVFENFIKPIVLKLNHSLSIKKPMITATLSKRLVSSLKHLEFVRMKCGKVGGRFIATPLVRGAGVTMSLVKADGILSVPKNLEGYEAGAKVEIELMRPVEEIENTLVTIGSHDVLIDVLSDIIHKSKKLVNLSSAHVGSLGGIMAMKKGECHLAPVHLLDEATGLYNLPAIEKYLGEVEIALIKGVVRVQGFIVQKGNPKNILGIDDLKREGIRYVNRQRGAGTRILLDFLFKQAGINPIQIIGYDNEVNTHMMVASAVKSGASDVGMGVRSAANMMDLDFIPVGEEEYDFIVDKRILEDEKVTVFLEALKSQEFKKALDTLGGYSLKNPGDVVYMS